MMRDNPDTSDEESLSQVLRTSVFDQPVRTEFLDIQFSLLVFVQSVKLLSHESHPCLLGNLSVLVRLHQKDQIFDGILSKCELILRLWHTCFRLRDDAFGY